MKNKIFLILPAIALLALTACNDWLNVGSKTEMTQDRQFSDAQGFQDALVGVYVGLDKSHLYGKDATWMSMDCFAQYWGTYNGDNNLRYKEYAYSNAAVRSTLTAIWDGNYNLIANCNNILRYLEKNRHLIDNLNYELIKGEALALRAFLHLDLMRMFGYGNLRNRPATGTPAIPYVTEYTKKLTPQLPYDQTFKLLEKDLLDAIKLLWGTNGSNCFPGALLTAFFSFATTAFFSFFGSALLKIR